MVAPCGMQQAQMRRLPGRSRQGGLAGRTPRLREDMLFEHSFPLMMSVSLRGGMGHRHEIFNGPLTETRTNYSISIFNWLKGILTLTCCKKNGTHLLCLDTTSYVHTASFQS